MMYRRNSNFFLASASSAVFYVISKQSICGVEIYEHDVIWYGDKYISKDDSRWSTSIRNTYNNIKNQNEDGGGRHNWTADEIDNVVNGMIFLQAC